MVRSRETTREVLINKQQLNWDVEKYKLDKDMNKMYDKEIYQVDNCFRNRYMDNTKCILEYVRHKT